MNPLRFKSAFILLTSCLATAFAISDMDQTLYIPSISVNASSARLLKEHSTLSPRRLEREQNQCGIGYIDCGPYCCAAGSTCTVDINANFACCPRDDFCTGTPLPPSVGPTVTMFLPNSAAGRVRPLSILTCWSTLYNAISAQLSPRTPHGEPVAAMHASLTAAEAAESANAALEILPLVKEGNWKSMPAAQQDCPPGRYLVKEWQMCCINDTRPHTCGAIARGCCSASLQALDKKELEENCPREVGESYLKPLRYGVTSQASRLSLPAADFFKSLFATRDKLNVEELTIHVRWQDSDVPLSPITPKVRKPFTCNRSSTEASVEKLHGNAPSSMNEANGVDITAASPGRESRSLPTCWGPSGAGCETSGASSLRNPLSVFDWIYGC